MKFRITMKDPDGVFESLKDAASENLKKGSEFTEDQFYNVASKWIEYGEYITVEIDMEAGTCVVVPVN